MALHEVLNTVQRNENILVVAVPGAGTFKAEWATHFKGKNVRVLFDNDDAGRKGALKAHNLLKSSVNDLKFLHWNEKHDVGFDVRDLYVKQCKLSAKKVMEFIDHNLFDEPPGVTDPDLLTTTAKDKVERKVAKLEGPGADPEEVYKAYQRGFFFLTSMSLTLCSGPSLLTVSPVTLSGRSWSDLQEPRRQNSS